MAVGPDDLDADTDPTFRIGALSMYPACRSCFLRDRYVVPWLIAGRRVQLHAWCVEWRDGPQVK